MNSEPSLKNLLIQYLSGVPNMFYPKIELRVINTSPLQVVDSFLDFIDLSNLGEAIYEQMAGHRHRLFKITLKKWNFVFNRIPNGTEFYFDIEARNFKVEEIFEEMDGIPSRLSQDDDVLYAFEKRRRQEMRRSNNQYQQQRPVQPPRVRRNQRSNKRNSKLRPIRGVLKKNTRSSKSYSRGRSASRERSFSKGRSNSRGRDAFEADKFEALSIAELSNMGDNAPALSYVSEKVDFNDAMSVTSHTNTMVLGELIDIEETSRRGSSRKEKKMNSAKVNRVRSRSRSKSKDLKSAQKLRKQGGFPSMVLFRDRSKELTNRQKKKMEGLESGANMAKRKLDLDDLSPIVGTQGKFREMSKRRKAKRNRRFKQ